MDDHQYVMSTSMAQYLEEMDNILKKNTVAKPPEELMELTSEGKVSNFDPESQINLEEMPDQGIGFDFGHTSAFNGSVFTETPSLNDITTPEETKENDTVMTPPEDNKSIEEEIEKLEISKPKKRNTKKKNSDPEESFKEPKTKAKQRVSDKERARKSRLRKKKYYEDLENKVHYLEDLCKKLTKEVQFYKEKIRLTDNSNERSHFKSNLEREAALMDAIQKKIMDLDAENFKVFETIDAISKNFRGFGKNKLEILEQSFDQFLENTLMGKDFKGAFYSCDKDFPMSFTALQSYSKMKKFQKYEKYPDEKVRDFIDVSWALMPNEDAYNNFLINKLPAIRETKKALQEGITELFKAKQMIYKALMQNEVSCELMEPKMTKDKLISYLEAMKQGNMKITYREAFEIQEEEVEVEMNYHLPCSKTFQKYSASNCGPCPPTIEKPPISEVSGKYKIKVLKSALQSCGGS